MPKQRMCTEECLSGYYKTKKYCCHFSCPREDKCTNKCKENWEDCGCCRLIRNNDDNDF